MINYNRIGLLFIILGSQFEKSFSFQTQLSKLLATEANQFTPKYWTSYIKKFLFNTLAKYVSPNEEKDLSTPSSSKANRSGIVTVLIHLRKSEAFMRHSYSTKETFSSELHTLFCRKCVIYNKISRWSKDHLTCANHPTAVGQPNVTNLGYNSKGFAICCCDYSTAPFNFFHLETFQVKNASGVFSFKYPESDFKYYASFIGLGTRNVHWNFIVDKMLSFNCSFLSLYFSRRVRSLVGSTPCEQGNLQLNKTQNILHLSKLKFCQHYSQFYIYVHHSHVTVNMMSHYTVACAVKFAFTVFDKQLVETAKEVSPIASHKTPFSVVAFKDHSHLISYLVQVEKTRYIILTMSNETKFGNRIFTYDGPDFRSKETELTTNVQIFSTFQCLLQVQTNRDFMSILCFNFSSDQQTILHTVFLDGKFPRRVTLPNQQCSNHICTVKVTTSSSLKVNATTTNYSATGKPDYTCIFGGLVVANSTTSGISELICQMEKSVNTLEGRSFYSWASSVVFLLFWYKHHSTIFTSLHLSSTACLNVIFDPCSDYFVMYDTFTNEQQKSGILLKTAQYTMRKTAFSPGLIATAQTGRCSVFQFVSRPDAESRR